MSTSLTSYLHPYAQQLVLHALSRIRGARLLIKLEYQDPPETIQLGDGVEGDPRVVLTVHNPGLWMRLCSNFDLGFAESYMFQDVDCDNLTNLINLYIKNKPNLGSGNPLLQFLPRVAWYLQRPSNDLQQARSNISSHYDTSNALFSAFLSADMNYSCAHWAPSPGQEGKGQKTVGEGEGWIPEEALETAQKRKIHSFLRKLDLKPSHHLLDIGCGWGDVAITAAQTTGCRVTGVTLSEEQKALAEERVRGAGLAESGRVRILLCDYRDTPAPDDEDGNKKEFYDRIISIGMFEHVGPQFLEGYFGVIERLLHPTDGRVLVDGITRTNGFHNTRSPVPTFIDRYIFPGGFLPPIATLLNAIHTGTNGSLEVTSVQNTGPHYGKTLLAWRDKFVRNWEGRIREDYRAEHPGASDVEVEAFRRKWLFYFVYCEAGFRVRWLGNYVVVAARTPEGVIGYEDESLGAMLV